MFLHLKKTSFGGGGRSVRKTINAKEVHRKVFKG